MAYAVWSDIGTFMITIIGIKYLMGR
ncbi:hypothetical protein [Paenibacillus amylolyticus]